MLQGCVRTPSGDRTGVRASSSPSVGRERSEDLATEARDVAALEAARADWWHEYVPPRLTLQEARRRIESGPVRARSGPAATMEA